MKIYESVAVTVDKLASITCNKCGKTATQNLEHDQEYMFQSVSLSFGYTSKFDEEIWNFDICDDCLEQFVDTFAIKPDIR